DWILWNLTIGPVQPIQHIATVPTGSVSLELLCRPTIITIHLGIKSLSIDQLLGIIHPNNPNTIVTAIAVLATDPVATPVTRAIVGLTVGLYTPINWAIVASLATCTGSTEEETCKDIKPSRNKQLLAGNAHHHPPNISTQFQERPKGHFPRLEERMNKEFVQQHRTAWNLDGYYLVDQKSRYLGPPPTGYAEGNVQVTSFIEAHNRGHRFYIHEYQAFWKEYCYKLFERKTQQSEMRKDSPRSPGRRYDNDKNDKRNRRDSKTSLAFMEAQFDKGINSEPNWIQPIEDNFWQASNRQEPQVPQNNNPEETRIQALRLQRQDQGQNLRRNLLPLYMGLQKQPANPDSRMQTPHVNICEMANDKQIFLPNGLQRRNSWTDSEEKEEPNQINPMVPPKVSTQNVIINAIQTQMPERRPKIVTTSTQQRLIVQIPPNTESQSA
ncbi:MAG: hypothetical protein EZS28_039770, partial [Streblomastix strix]